MDEANPSATPPPLNAGELFERYASGVGSFFLARVGDPELAEELTSRVFVQVVQRLEQCRGNACGWIWAIANSILSRHYRDKGRRKPDAAEEPVYVDPLQSAENREWQALLPGILAELSPREQELVFLKFFQDLSNQQIAEATDLTVSNVGVILFRALKRLRSRLEPTASTLAKEQE